ncbi:UNVERIFIED_CONTAM: hypothetical protein Sangu_0774500 [Sesamum angustifolium]|uniref:Uncharacterized protein n=1 Tax=Sesamum angustifolium TaxID=2727405 RepID=A0AAW2PU37_9LAMI
MVRKITPPCAQRVNFKDRLQRSTTSWLAATLGEILIISLQHLGRPKISRMSSCSSVTGRYTLPRNALAKRGRLSRRPPYASGGACRSRGPR